ITPYHARYSTRSSILYMLFSFTAPATTGIYTLSLHDALPISVRRGEAEHGYRGHGDHRGRDGRAAAGQPLQGVLLDLLLGERERSEEHTSELQSRSDLVCRLLLEKKKMSLASAK